MNEYICHSLDGLFPRQLYKQVSVFAFTLHFFLLGCESGPEDYFPIEKQTRWVYEIQVGDHEPLYQQIIYWPIGNGRSEVTLDKKRFNPLVGGENRKTFWLDLQVKERQLGETQFAEIEIVRDELDIFQHAQKIYYTIDEKFVIREFVIYRPNTLWDPRAPYNLSGLDPGYSSRIIFFDDGAGAVLTENETWESITYMGEVQGIDGNEDKRTRHFIRKVKPTEYGVFKNSGIVSKGFTEETWYEKGRGLVRLEQRVDGNLSMVWRLTEFSR